MKIKYTCEMAKGKKKQQTKETRTLRKIKRGLKIERRTETNPKKIKEIVQRKKLITKYIVQEEEERHKRKIVRVIENLRKEGKGMKEDTFWEFKKKLEQRKEEQASAIRTENGKILEDKEEILQEYENFYERLLGNIQQRQ